MEAFFSGTLCNSLASSKGGGTWILLCVAEMESEREGKDPLWIKGKEEEEASWEIASGKGII